MASAAFLSSPMARITLAPQPAGAHDRTIASAQLWEGPGKITCPPDPGHTSRALRAIVCRVGYHDLVTPFLDLGQEAAGSFLYGKKRTDPPQAGTPFRGIKNGREDPGSRRDPWMDTSSKDGSWRAPPSNLNVELVRGTFKSLGAENRLWWIIA